VGSTRDKSVEVPGKAERRKLVKGGGKNKNHFQREENKHGNRKKQFYLARKKKKTEEVDCKSALEWKRGIITIPKQSQKAGGKPR